MIGFILFAVVFTGVAAGVSFNNDNYGLAGFNLSLCAFNCFNFAVNIGV